MLQVTLLIIRNSFYSRLGGVLGIRVLIDWQKIRPNVGGDSGGRGRGRGAGARVQAEPKHSYDLRSKRNS